MAQRTAGARRRAVATKRTKKSTRTRAAGKSVPRSGSPAARLQHDLPATLGQFSKRMHTRLTRLERRVSRAESRYRRRWVRLLREASHQLGRFEAAGEKRWRRLTRQARRDTQKLLRRLDKALEPTPKAQSGAASRSRARSGSRMRVIRRRAKR